MAAAGRNRRGLNWSKTINHSKVFIVAEPAASHSTLGRLGSNTRGWLLRDWTDEILAENMVSVPTDYFIAYI